MVKVWLFEGESDSLWNIFRAYLERAVIKRNVMAHTLRHSFASHLVEQGAGLRYILPLPELRSSKTTNAFDKIASLLDNL
ncbi:tyrosine-type recombinase/integrase [Pontibacter sp. 13R65]|uniref:tyrosine-type recombinase/integrase n=1 Tax=Pontibacter sp. 13R65 TaxID=3127458 RepID=UPI00301B8E2A